MQPDSEKAVDNLFRSSLYFSSSALGREAEKLAAEYWKPLGLTPSQAAIVVLLLSSFQTTVGPSYLAKSLLLSPSTMTRLLKKLEAKEFVDLFEYNGIRMVEPGPAADKLADQILACDAALDAKFRELLGGDNLSGLTHHMNRTTDLLRSHASGSIPNAAKGDPAAADLPGSAAAGALPDIAAGECPTADEKSGRESRPLPRKLIVMSTPEQGRTVEAAYLQKSISYEAYTRLIDELVTNGQTTGPDQSEAFIHYTALNQQRMHRWEKTIQLLPSVETALKSVTDPQTWLVLTEAWCGDAAHSIPVLHALAALNPLITLRFVFRDENPELMDRYLTNGVSRSIPKLIALDTATREELFTWGPRPAPLQATFLKMREEGIAYAAIKEELQRWYNKDKSVTIQQEMAALATATNTGMGMTA